MTEIVTDQSALRQVSKPVNIENNSLSKDAQEVVKKLISSIPDNGAGLAAPQISEFQRIFIARLSVGHFVFVNPTLSKGSDRKTPSVEGCLSIPGVTWCINRHQSITVDAELVFIIKDEDFSEIDQNMPIEVFGVDSYIVQHEHDHLEGVLIIDHSRAESVDERLVRKTQERQQRIQARRTAKLVSENQKKAKQKVNPKVAAKLKKMEKAARRQDKKRVEIQERLRAEQEGLFTLKKGVLTKPS